MKWPTYRLDQCTEIVSGSTPKTDIEKYWDGEINWATPKDLSNLNQKIISDTPDKITQEGYDSCSTQLLPVGSVLFSSRAPIGHVAINGVPMCTNQGFKSFISKKELLDASYLYYWLIFKRDYLQSLGNGATFKEVSKATIARVEIPLPPLEEQRRIAAILDKAEALRAKRREAIAKLDQLLQSVFLEMFGDPFANNKNLPKAKLSDICSEIVDCPHSTPEWVDSGKLCIRTSNLGYGEWIWDDKRYITPDSFLNRIKRSKPQADDIVLSREGTVGVAAIVTANMEISLGQRLVQLRPNKKYIIPSYLLKSLLIILSPEKISRFMVGATSKHLNVKELRNLEIPIPSMFDQNKFQEIYNLVEKNRNINLLGLSKTENLISSFQSKYFN